MKKTKLQLIFIFFLIAILHTNCSSHCDDEDYTRDQKEATLRADVDTLHIVRD
jgi:preprotein translocase subunit SecG